MTLPTILDFVNLFFAGMLAGIEFVIHYGLHGPSQILDDRSQLQLRQALIVRLKVLVPAFFAPTAVLGIALTVLGSGTPGFWFRCAAVIAVSTWIVIRGRTRITVKTTHKSICYISQVNHVVTVHPEICLTPALIRVPNRSCSGACTARAALSC